MNSIREVSVLANEKLHSIIRVCWMNELRWSSSSWAGAFVSLEVGPGPTCVVRMRLPLRGRRRCSDPAAIVGSMTSPSLDPFLARSAFSPIHKARCAVSSMQTVAKAKALCAGICQHAISQPLPVSRPTIYRLLHLPSCSALVGRKGFRTRAEGS